MSAADRTPTTRHTGTIDRLARSKLRGAQWLLTHLHAQGRVATVDEGFRFYRLPWSLTISGHTEAATAVCAWIREHMFTHEGDFDGGYRQLRDAYAYRNATLIYGAHMARQYDLSSRGLRFVLQMQDDLSGGFANDRNVDGTLSDVMDVPYTCGCGLACIAVGQLDPARAVYKFLQKVWSEQDELPDRLYYSFSRDQQAVITTYNNKNAFWHVVESQQGQPQRWTVGGIAAAFLCRLYMVNSNPAYLSLARNYQQFSIDSTPQQFEFPQVCKSGWGAGLLYQLTGEPVYSQWATKVGDWFINTQAPDGSWVFDPNATEGQILELTAEFVAHIDSIIGCLASRP